MTLYQFAQLDEAAQINAFKQAIVIGKRTAENRTIECRQIDDFYVEYEIIETNLVNLRSFRNPDHLSPYLDDINIEALLEC